MLDILQGALRRTFSTVSDWVRVPHAPGAPLHVTLVEIVLVCVTTTTIKVLAFRLGSPEGVWEGLLGGVASSGLLG
jgi:hypothetical protein